MKDLVRPEQMTRRQTFFIALVLALLASTAPIGVGTRQAAAATAAQGGVIDAQEVRTVWTSEFGVAHPAGLAYDPSRQEFLVAEDDPDVTSVLRVGPDGERRGTFTLPQLSDPETLAINAAQDELIAIDDSEEVQASTSALSTRKPRTKRAPLDELQLGEPASATFDAETDTWFILEEQGDSVAIVDGDDRTSQPDEVPLAQSAADRVIAFNPDDDLLYVLDPVENRVDAVDRDGTVEKRVDLASTELSDPVAMTFAPSTDTTDDPDDLNLYVADAGGGARALGGVTEVSVAPVTAAVAASVNATLVRTVQTSAWTPASPDPAGIVWTPADSELVVVDSEVNETTGAGWNNVNLWRTTKVGNVVGTGALWGPRAAGNFSKEPTGLGYDNASRTLFVSDDSAEKIFVVKRGSDGDFGTTDDVVTSVSTVPFGGVDTEDPEFDRASGHLFYLDGVGREIYRINPVDNVFGNANDTVTHFDISHLGPADFEGLTSDPGRGTLYVGARTTEQIFEITHDGTLLRTISAAGISGLRFISGLAVAPASTGGSTMNMWIVDRAVDNGADPNENDGKMFEIAVPDIGGAPSGNRPPVAANDTGSTGAGSTVSLPVLANDSDPDGQSLTVTNLTQPANGSVTVKANNTVAYTPRVGFSGSDTFTYRANDGQAASNVARVTVTVANVPKIVIHRIVYNPPGKDTRTNSQLKKELIVVRNVGSKGRGIGRWTVRDKAGHVYTIPRKFRIGSGVSVRIHTGKGTNDSNDLFWRRTRYVWNNGGDTATLRKATGKFRDRCTYPGGGSSVRC